MCGIFGFVSKDGRGPSIRRMQEIARVTESRGRHAFGLAWEWGGELETYKRPGAASHRLGDLEMVEGSQAVIGHCRWATHGLPEENVNNHPHPAGSGWLMHNGVVSNYIDLVVEHELEIETECDSEVLGILMRRGRGTLLDRARYMRKHVDGTMAVMGIWANPVRLLVMRSGRPLHFGEDSRGFYFASLAGSLPGKVHMLRDERTLAFNSTGGYLQMRSKSLGSGKPDLSVA